MQAKRKTQPYDTFEPLFDGSCEVPIDMEYDMPDYCADIQKILKCRVVPELSSYAVSEDALRCEGVCDVRVLYLDAQGDSLRCCDFTKEFSATIQVKAAEEKAVAWVRASVEHITCRAVNARRIDLHVAVGLKALAVVQREESITCGLQEAGLERRVDRRQASRAVNAVSHQFTLEDRLPLKNGKPPIDAILRKEVACRSTSCKLAQEQLAVSGRADLSFLYRSSLDGAPEKMSASLEFDQVIECGGASEDCLCDLRITPGECVIRPREDDVGEYTSVDVTLKVFVTAFLYKACEVEFIDDAYSVRTPLELRYAQASLVAVREVYTESLKKKCSLTVTEDELQKVVDLWCEQENVKSTCEQGKLCYRVRYTVCLLYQGTSGRLFYTERAFEHSFSTEMEGLLPTLKSDTVSVTDLWEYRIAEKNAVEVSVETWASTLLYTREPVKYLAGAEAAEGVQPYPHKPRLLVYYASAGEKIWDIAKSHRTLLSDLREQNEVYEEALPEARPLILCNR